MKQCGSGGTGLVRCSPRKSESGVFITDRIRTGDGTGGKERLGSISKAGNRYLRQLLVVGALSVIRRAKQLGTTRHPWLVGLLERRSSKIAAVALANKIARIAWAMMARNESYQPSRLSPVT